MKKLFSILFLSLSMACADSTESKTDNEKSETTEASEASEAADTSTIIEKVDSTMKDAADTLQKKVVEPMKRDIKKAGEKVKEVIKEVKEDIKQ